MTTTDGQQHERNVARVMELVREIEERDPKRAEAMVAYGERLVEAARRRDKGREADGIIIRRQDARAWVIEENDYGTALALGASKREALAEALRQCAERVNDGWRAATMVQTLLENDAITDNRTANPHSMRHTDVAPMMMSAMNDVWDGLDFLRRLAERIDAGDLDDAPAAEVRQ